MAEAEDRETNQELANRIGQTIRSLTERIQGYVQSVNTFAGEYNTEVERLRGLIQRLRDCLERLVELGNGLNNINQRILLLGSRIANLQERVSTEVEAAGAGCREALRNIERQITDLQDMPGNFSIDIETLRGQVTDLENLIKNLCDDADGTIAELERRRGEINQTLDRMEEGDGGSGSGSGDNSAESKSAPLPTPQGQGIDLRGTPIGQRGSLVADRRAGIEGGIGQLMSGTTRATSPESEDARIRRQAERGYQRSRQGNRRNRISSGPRSQRGQRSDVAREPFGFGSASPRGLQGGWQTPEKLESLSRTRPVRTLAVLKKKKNKKTKKKKHRKRNKKTRGRNRRKKRSRKR